MYHRKRGMDMGDVEALVVVDTGLAGSRSAAQVRA